ncbi:MULTISPECIES: osmoprotectant ABC transporter ATP-binding protein OsmV [Paracoccus]|jgi:osmoprotectant transport system ATP-binding protein|uniref:Quaternary amine transport ATP-binding protein n=1 Tax=Paracoccus denitrificans (strain Pd 1222) TaxID=318586 RepID=A1BBQ2_PARDP|nr:MULTISPECIES: betaine/proline/choline family ABC transporter ATP-binding protein [Paracoccus]ABL72946.1 glycine betaine/L-proline ABC transporter, ATPase subunit [Paracoccus denitrificans PD1222]MBB4626424.1 osmoprotectant transport system ATP-binding protein [Paracoccus denitrificans]MCU7427372.1 betaine/proline/choline family ABC transporter ATP-binding protein [Paracoccus denitrificans]MDK8871282.1 betaine/proline/choline family ABC transporter ATP-binding protein [Paracoccus sp. SSJ]QAR
MIRLEDLTKRFKTPGADIVAADRVNMEVPTGEICILLGPSGCGKTTALKMINRLIPPTSGKIYIDGQDTSQLDDIQLRRNIGYVIQQIGLFPNMTIEENICVVPRLLNWDIRKARQRAADLLDLVGLDPRQFLRRYPKELSGGQQQRVGVIRALAADPPVMLMDEPFGAIDPINREIIQDEFLKMQAELKKTIMFVSHDIDEAVKMGDKIAIFRAGRIEQYDTPDMILAHPANAFVADFVGADRTLKRLRLVTAEEVASTEVPVTARSTKVSDALHQLTVAKARRAVVIDSDRRPVGFVTAEEMAGASGTVRDFAHPLPATVPVRADLRAVVSEMFAHDTMWLACTDDHGRFAGVITQPDVTAALRATYGPDKGAGPEQGAS